MINNRAAAWFALVLGSVALCSPARAQEIAAADAVDPLAPLAEGADPAQPYSEAASELTNWIIASGDNGGLPFIVIDKIVAEVFVFDARGQPLGATPALLGVTPGDESAEGVGDRELSDIKPEDRTTPAGRFVANFGPASGNRTVLWVDYATSISLHPVITTNKKERRLQRLNSPSSDDNRITYGCINVPAAFYADVVLPLLRDTAGVVYILPETKPLKEVFQSYSAPQQQAYAH